MQHDEKCIFWSLYKKEKIEAKEKVEHLWQHTSEYQRDLKLSSYICISFFLPSNDLLIFNLF